MARIAQVCSTALSFSNQLPPPWIERTPIIPIAGVPNPDSKKNKQVEKLIIFDE